MTDRELLELAAKAAGIENKIWHMNANAFWVDVDSDNPYWNPLTDDGDALRLAVKLMMSLALGPIRVQACTREGALRGNFFQEDIIDTDWNKSTRRAIVRAAAEIGKEMP